MEKIKTFIIDDEKNAREILKILIGRYFTEIQVVGEADSIKTGIELLNNKSADLVFLDIEFPTGTGFDILAGINKIDFDIIFVTAFDQYAIDAFRFSAVDYILKPVKISILKEAINKFKQKRKHKDKEQKFRVLIDNFNNNIHRIVLPTLKGFIVINIKDIIRCEGDRNYTNFFFVNNKSMLVCKTIKEFEELLTNHNFFRIHQSHLININHVKEYIRGKGGDVKMSDNSELSVSKYRKKDFLKYFKT